MAYSYKKDFFGNWKRKNGITTAEIADVLGIKSRDKIEMWAGDLPLPALKGNRAAEEDRGWLPLKHILRLCNHYTNLSFSDFIENVEDLANIKQRSKSSENKSIVKIYETALKSKDGEIASLQELIETQKKMIAMLEKRSVSLDHATLPPLQKLR